MKTSTAIAAFIATVAKANGQHTIRGLEESMQMSMANTYNFAFGGSSDSGYGSGSGGSSSSKSGKKFECKLDGIWTPAVDFCKLEAEDGEVVKTCDQNYALTLTADPDGTIQGTSNLCTPQEICRTSSVIGFYDKEQCSFKVVGTLSPVTIEGHVSSNNKMQIESTMPGGSDPLAITFTATVKKVVCPSSDSEAWEEKELQYGEFGEKTLFFKYAVVLALTSPEQGILCAHLETEGESWLGFGINTANPGKMVPGEAIIGLPDDVTVLKYNLSGKSSSKVQPMPDDQQTLMSTSITQKGGKTTLQFTKYLLEDDEYQILVPGVNKFIYAVGQANTLGYHGRYNRGSFDVDFE